jgi:hypothetical protein
VEKEALQPDLIGQQRKEQAQRERNDREPNYGRGNIETLVAFTQAVQFLTETASAFVLII